MVDFLGAAISCADFGDYILAEFGEGREHGVVDLPDLDDPVRPQTTLRVAVNLSPVQIMQGDLPEVVAGILHGTGLPPDRLELEVTESVQGIASSPA